MVDEINIETENSQPEAVNTMVEGFSLTGDILNTLEDKTAKIMEWSKKELPDLKNPDITNTKTILKLRLSNGATMDWIPNKTSLKSLMVVTKSMNMTDWINQDIELEVVKTKVSGEDKEVIYVKEA